MRTHNTSYIYDDITARKEAGENFSDLNGNFLPIGRKLKLLVVCHSIISRCELPWIKVLKSFL
jgi:hypothetical protein